MLRSALDRGLSATDRNIGQCLGRNCVTDGPQTNFLCGIALQLSRGIPVLREQSVIRRHLEGQAWMSRGDEVVIDGRSRRTDVALDALLGTSSDWPQVMESEVRFLGRGKRSPVSLSVSSHPRSGRTVATFAADTELDGKPFALLDTRMSRLRRMTRQAARLGVRGFESELLRHPNRRLVEQYVERPPMRDVASQPRGRLTADQRLAAVTARGGAAGHADHSMRNRVFRWQASRQANCRPSRQASSDQ